MSATVSRFVINDLNESLNEKSSWSSTLESNNGIDPALLKYNNCTTYTECRAINPNVATDVDENGAWNYRLYNLETDEVYPGTADGLFTIDGGNTPNTSLVTFNVDLPNLTDGYDMFHKCVNLASFDSDLPNLANGECMFFECCNLTTFTSDLPKLTDGKFMFYDCSNLTAFTSDLSSLTLGGRMFMYCTSLTSFNADLSNLTNGEVMFYNCSSLTTFTSDLPNLTNGDAMFSECSSLTEFYSDLSKLTGGYNMFNNCSNLTTFTSDLSSLVDGSSMFESCSSLTEFYSDLSKLTGGYWMFQGCKLNTTSVKNIADTINTVSSGNIHIDIGNSTPNTEEETAFNTIASKGWAVYVNGSSWTSTNPTSATNLTEGEEQSTPIPFYAKSVQVTEDVAEYVDANNNYYNIVGGQFIYGDDLSTYGVFTSYEHAVEEISIALGLTKYTNPTAREQQRTLDTLLRSN